MSATGPQARGIGVMIEEGRSSHREKVDSRTAQREKFFFLI